MSSSIPTPRSRDRGPTTIGLLADLVPPLRSGLPGVAVLVVFIVAGRLAVPVAIQQILDQGLPATGEPDLDLVRRTALLCVGAVLLTMVLTYLLNRRLSRTAEAGLAVLRARVFRRVHDLPSAVLGRERRGATVSLVTSDIDQISAFLQLSGGLVVTWGQLLAANLLMIAYSWQLTLVVWFSFVPFVLLLRYFQRRIAEAYVVVRARLADLLSVVSEAVVGVGVIQSFGATARVAARVDTLIRRHRRAQRTALVREVMTFSSGEVGAALATGLVVAVAVLLGSGHQMTIGRLVAFLFLITLFVGPVQMATDMLNRAQNAAAALRGIRELLDAPVEVADPGAAGVDLPPGPAAIQFHGVRYAYPGGSLVLDDISLAIQPGRRIAVVGPTGSGKTTFARLLTRLIDPTDGQIFLSGVPLRSIRFDSLRRSVVTVPQDGFLFDASVCDNVRYGRLDATDDDIRRVFADLQLSEWLEALPEGLATRVGQRGSSLSVGERQLVALARAHLADPALLVLDEATSSVDPMTEIRLQRALEEATRGRTAVSVAHRLATAEVADEVLVFEAGRIVQRGPHAELLGEPGVYARLYSAWSLATSRT